MVTCDKNHCMRKSLSVSSWVASIKKNILIFLRLLNYSPTKKAIQVRMEKELIDLKEAFQGYPVGGNDSGGNQFVAFLATVPKVKLETMYKSKFDA